jgi:hypothetical protein
VGHLPAGGAGDCPPRRWTRQHVLFDADQLGDPPTWDW